MRHKFQRILACLLAFTLLTCPALAESSFPDVSNDAPYAEAVEYLNDAGIMMGDGKGNFNPDRAVTRAQMAAIVCRMMSEAESAKKDGTIFSDVPESYWANATIVRAAELGIIGGYQDGTFKPDNPVTYEQAVTMVIRTIGGKSEADKAGGYPNGFMSVASQYGFLDNVQAQTGASLSRANVAVIIYNSIGFSFESGGSSYNDGDQTD